ncbi:hypothetical protein ATCC90586_011900 [Pythium insidiosum]|nr:hypothetical protein ATCC90586_011900 [Pythium insidiosum]
MDSVGVGHERVVLADAGRQALGLKEAEQPGDLARVTEDATALEVVHLVLRPHAVGGLGGGPLKAICIQEVAKTFLEFDEVLLAGRGGDRLLRLKESLAALDRYLLVWGVSLDDFDVSVIVILSIFVPIIVGHLIDLGGVILFGRLA